MDDDERRHRAIIRRLVNEFWERREKMKDNAFKQLLNKFKKTISENREEIIAQAVFMGLMSTYGITMWKLGAASVWPPKHLNLKFLESNDGKQYLLLNGILFKPDTK